MKWQFINRGGGTSVALVQFGVAPNCGGGRTIANRLTGAGGQLPPSVLGATPETTGPRPVPPVFGRIFLRA